VGAKKLDYPVWIGEKNVAEIEVGLVTDFLAKALKSGAHFLIRP